MSCIICENEDFLITVPVIEGQPHPPAKICANCLTKASRVREKASSLIENKDRLSRCGIYYNNGVYYVSFHYNFSTCAGATVITDKIARSTFNQHDIAVLSTLVIRRVTNKVDVFVESQKETKINAAL